MIARRAPIARSGRPRARRATPRRSGRVLDPDFMAWVRGQSCLLAHVGGCQGRVEADHAGPRPLGRKASDDTTIPLCTGHHRQRTDARGYFAGFSAAAMREWCAVAIANTQRDRAAWVAAIASVPW